MFIVISIFVFFGGVILLKFWPKENKENTYKVEYYPESGFYLPVVNGHYLFSHHPSGILSYNKSLMCFAERFSKESQAWECIDKWKEQSLKENVVVLTR